MTFAVKPLGELCNLTMGRTPPRGNPKFWDSSHKTKNIWISIADMTKSLNRTMIDSKEYLSDAGSKTFPKVKKGTLLLSFKLSIGKLAIAGTDLQTNEAIVAMNELKENLILRDYLYYFLFGFDWSAALEGRFKVKGNTLNKRILEALPIKFPPLEMQHEIVEKLDSAFTEINLLEKNLNSLDSLIAECDFSILEQILTPNENQLANHRSATLGDISELISRGISPSYLDTANTFILNQRCIRNGSINLDFARRHNEKVRKVQETKLLRDGDGLINSTGVGTLGRTALFKKYGIGEYTVDSHVTIVRPKLEVLNPDYFGLVLKALENVFVSLSTGTSGQTELPRESVKETSVTFPINLADQVDFYEYYSSINYALGDIIKSVAERRSLASYLRRSFLSSAFSQEEVVA